MLAQIIVVYCDQCYNSRVIFSFHRKSFCFLSLLIELIQLGSVVLRNLVCKNKNDYMVHEFNLTEANPCFACAKFLDSREATASLKYLAPWPPRFHNNTVENQLNPIIYNDVAEIS